MSKRRQINDVKVVEDKYSVSKSTLSELQELGFSPEDCIGQENLKVIFKKAKSVERDLQAELGRLNVNQNLKVHLEELHNYNSIKDATQSLLGSLSLQTEMYRNSRKRVSSSKAESEMRLSVSKDSLTEAISLVFEEGSKKSKEVDFGGTRTLKKCHSASLKAHNLCSAAEIFSPESSTTIKILEELRMSLLENNFYDSSILLKWLLYSSSKLFLPVIWKAAAVLFLNHFSFQGCHEEFLQMCADQRLSKDKRILFKALVSLPDLLESKTKKSLMCNVSSLEKSNIDDSDDDDF